MSFEAVATPDEQRFAIEVHGVSKAFPVYAEPHHRLLQLLLPGDQSHRSKSFRALSDLSFSIPKGQTVGIVGRNGSGKSTILQIICGTLTPTTGSVTVRGRVAALLELGAGFNPEFTGRENVYLNASVLGLTRAEVDDRLGDILGFADIGDFIDQPVKTYSSGMYVRLAFAVAIHVDPDILVVDEALAVGDEAFQRKCFARIDAIRAKGTTILFVSHSAGTVIELCDRALLLDGGELIADGTPKIVIGQYQKLLYAPRDKVEAIREAIRGNEPIPGDDSTGGGKGPVGEQDVPPDEPFFDPSLKPASTIEYERRGAEILDPFVETLDGRRVNVLVAGRTYVYRYRVRLVGIAAGLRFGMMIRTVTGVEVCGSANCLPEHAHPVAEPGSVFDAQFRFRCLLAPGVYFLNAGVLGLVGEEEGYLDRRIDVAMIRVLPYPSRLGTALVDLDVEPRVSLRQPGVTS